MSRARVFKEDGMWHWRCTACDNFGGGGRTWVSAMYGVELHLDDHDDNAPCLEGWAPR